jgi:transposase
MPKRKSMRRIKECLRLSSEAGLSHQSISQVLKIARSTVGDYHKRFERCGKSWAELKDLPDASVEALLFPVPSSLALKRHQPDWGVVHKELTSKSYMTLQLLWEEYRAIHADGYSYPRYCVHYREWAQRLKVYQRQHHVVGEKLFVDYSGKKPRVRDATTGVDREVEFFVMAWGVSHFIYAEAHESQRLSDWIMGHRRGYEYFGCVPHIEVDDNLKSAISKACRYDPDTNPTFTEFAEHYGVAIIPARPRKPKDKPKVENAVLIVQRWILACLRHRVFYTLAALNSAIRELVEKANDKPMQRIHKSRREQFLELDKPNALPLPAVPFEYREWSYPTVGFDYHVQVDGHFYSVPWTLAKKKVSVRLMEQSVEIFDKEDRVAIHVRSQKKHSYTTVTEHMPQSHQKYLEWTPARLFKWAAEIGSATQQLIEKVIKTKFQPQQGFRPALGILRLAKTYGNTAFEAAAQIALVHGFVRVKQIECLLKNSKDKGCLQTPTKTVTNTDNIRGSDYYLDEPTPAITTPPSQKEAQS